VDNLDIHFLDDQFVVYNPGTDRIHYLNGTAALILDLCDGSHSVPEIVMLVKETYSLTVAPEREVDEGLTNLQADGLVA
jgi:hypothetical protein